ncbi:hypothetical protein D3C80_1257540 [compost metagenome]
MAAGATGAQARAEADQQAGEQQPRHADLHLDHRQLGERQPQQGRQQQAEDEQQAVQAAAGLGIEQAAEQATDAGDAAVGEDEQPGGQAEQDAAGQGAPGGEMGPVDDHGRSSEQNCRYRVWITASAAGSVMR